MEKSKINKLFSSLCCSDCKTDFNENSIHIIRQEDSLYVIQIICPACGKSFGLAFMGVSSVDINEEDVSEADLALEIQEEPSVISTDDVLDAHEFIKNLDESWAKYLPPLQ